MDADNGTVDHANHLDGTTRFKDVALSVTCEVVVVEGDVGLTVLFLGRDFAEPNRGNLGLGVGDLGDVEVGNNDRVETSELFRNEDSVLVTAVRELKTGNDVADRVNPGNICLKSLVGQHVAAVHSDANRFETTVVCGRSATDGDEQDITFDGFATLERHDDSRVALSRGLESNTGLEFDSALAVRPFKLLGDGLVFCRNEPRKSFNDGYLGTPRAPHAREFDTNHAAAEHDDLLRHVVEGDCLLRGHDSARNLEARNRLGVGTGREYNVLTADGVIANLNRGGGGESSVTVDHLNPACLEETLQTLVL